MTTKTFDGTNGSFANGGFTNGCFNAFKYFINQMGKVTLVSAVIFTFVMPVLNVAFNYFGVFANSEKEWLAYPIILQSAIPYFMLVLGIVAPCYMELLLGYGITRRQQAVGLLAAAVIISIATGVVCAAFLLLTEGFSPSQVIEQVLSNWYYFLVGWIVVLGYQYRRVFAAMASTLAGIVLLGFWALGNPWMLSTATSIFMEVAPVLRVAFGIALCLLIPVVIVVCARRISIKI